MRVRTTMTAFAIAATLLGLVSGCGASQDGEEKAVLAEVKAFVVAVNDGDCTSEAVGLALGTEACEALKAEKYRAKFDPDDPLRVLEVKGRQASARGFMHTRFNASTGDGFYEPNIDPVFDLTKNDSGHWQVLRVSEGFIINE